MIRIGARIGPEWLENTRDLDFLRSLGVEYVDVEFDLFPGFQESAGMPNRSAIAGVVELLRTHGLRIERANYTKTHIASHYLGLPTGAQAIDNLCQAAELCGDFEIPVMGIQCFDATVLLGRNVGNHSWLQGRGGYQYLHIDVAAEFEANWVSRDIPTLEGLWGRTFDLFAAVLPVAESAGVRVASHGSDPPIAVVAGIPQMLTSCSDFDRLFLQMPAANNGMTFCVGTRYESGEDVFEGIQRFGSQNRIAHVHFRNVRGTIPALGAYSEVAPDEGDLDMQEVVRALHANSYQGVIDYDHVMKLPGDSSVGRDYIAFCIGYMQGLLAGI